MSRILVVDDDRGLCETLVKAMSRRGFDVAYRQSAEQALALLQEEDFDAVVTDLHMDGMGGLALCERVTANRPDVPVIVLTAFGTLERAIGAIRAGAYDFVTKPFDIEVLHLTLRRAVQHRALREEVRRLKAEVSASRRPSDMLGESKPFAEVLDLVDRVADTETTVLISGESGTGKELVARALHARGRRAGGQFVAVNCAALPEQLLESELFGHARGAFTDARTARQGLFLLASGGTLFLDEVGELPLPMQAKLLRAIQERTVRPVGGDREVPHDARLVAATNRDLETEVAQKRFREDLYYRINVVQIEVPPLRARGNDVLLLAGHFLKQAAAQMGKPVRGLSAPVAERLVAYRWPGNVRELQNCIEQAVALTRFEELVVDDLPERVRSYRVSDLRVPGVEPGEVLPIAEVERRYILRVLEQLEGNKTLAAELLGLDRRTLYRKLERYGGSGSSGGSDGK